MRFEDLTGASVVIWGAGREGRAALAELTRRGIQATVAVTGDAAVPADLAPVAVSGPAALERLENADVVVKSPGIAHTAAEFRRLKERQVPVTSLTDLWLSANHDHVIAVTGTKGKSTTSALVHHLLTELGVSASLVGNGGTPVTADEGADAQVAVAEVSSYQAADLTVSPRVAVVTSLYPEHLPWHGGFERYVADKLNLVAHGPEVVVVPDTEAALADHVAARLTERTRLLRPADLGLAVTEHGLVWDGIGEVPTADIPVRGVHNVTNLALALAAVATYADLTTEQRARALAAVVSFAPLAHRLEPVPSDDGRTWVDDGLATAPEAVVAALETYPTARLTLIVGGSDRGLSFAPLTDYLAHRSTEATEATVDVVAVGPAGARLASEVGHSNFEIRLAPDFATALRWIREDQRSDVVLLSPGAPAFDEFTDYAARSAAFRAAAGGVAPAGTPGRENS